MDVRAGEIVDEVNGLRARSATLAALDCEVIFGCHIEGVGPHKDGTTLLRNGDQQGLLASIPSGLKRGYESNSERR